MSLKEGLSPNKRKFLMGSLLASEGMDILTTGAGFHLDSVNPNYVASEVNPFGGKELITNFEFNEVAALKLAVIAIMIGVYALSTNHNLRRSHSNKHLEMKSGFIFDSAFIGANILAWGIIAWNAAQLSKAV